MKKYLFKRIDSQNVFSDFDNECRFCMKKSTKLERLKYFCNNCKYIFIVNNDNDIVFEQINVDKCSLQLDYNNKESIIILSDGLNNKTYKVEFDNFNEKRTYEALLKTIKLSIKRYQYKLLLS